MRTLLHVSLISISHNSTSNNQLQGSSNGQSYSRKCHYHMLQQCKWQLVTANVVFVGHNIRCVYQLYQSVTTCQPLNR
jgi:hypothetical protein